MDLKEHYDNLWKQSLEKFNRHAFEFDDLIDSEDDNRYGVTLLARPSDQVKQKIAELLDSIRPVAPGQYYYPQSDLHLTVLSIISCYPGFTLDQIDKSKYKEIVQSAIDPISPFRIRFRGLTASPSCILIQGFPEDNRLQTLRDRLRNKFKQSDLQHSIDKRYKLQTAHITAIRFKEPFADAKAFVKTVANLRNIDFGSCEINQLELVANDWYQQKDKVELIERFAL